MLAFHFRKSNNTPLVLLNKNLYHPFTLSFVLGILKGIRFLKHLPGSGAVKTTPEDWKNRSIKRIFGQTLSIHIHTKHTERDLFSVFPVKYNVCLIAT